MIKNKTRQILFCLHLLIMTSLTPLTVKAEDTVVTDEIQKEIVTQQELIRTPAPEYYEKEPEAPVELESDKETADLIKGPSFHLREVKIEGNTLFSPEDFKDYLDRYLNHTVSFSDLRDLTLLITNHYRSRGYATSRAYIPAQKMQGGIVTIQIIEGKIGKVMVEGNKWFSSKSYQKVIALKKDQIFRVQDLETGLRSINTQPDRSAKAYLIAGEQPLTSDVILKAKDKFPVHAAYEFNNHGSKLTHRARHEIALTHNNVSGNGDSLAANLSLAEQSALTGGTFNYRLPFHSTRTIFLLNASIIHTRLAKHLREFKVRGKSWSLTPGLNQTFFESRRFTFSGYAGFEIKDSKTALDEEKISFDRMRVLKAGPRIDIRDKWGRSSLGVEAHLGIPGFLGGSDPRDADSTREGAGGKFIYFTPTASRLMKLPYSFLLFSRANAQLSPQSLTSLEQFRSGGAFSVRGYPEGDSSGDSGFNVINELRIPSIYLPKNWLIPRTKRALRDTFSLIAFYDLGYTHFDSRSRPEVEKDRLLAGVGYGVRFNLDRYLSIVFDMGFPVGDKSTDKNNPQIHMSVRSEY